MKIRLPWKAKALAFAALEVLPFGGDDLHYFLQRHVTRSIPRDLASLQRFASLARWHVNAFTSHGADPEGVLMGFGAGWDLYEFLCFYGLGIQQQVAFDIKPLARLDLINHAIDYLAVNPPLGAASRPFARLGPDLRRDLASRYGIEYRAPADASCVPDLPAGSVEMITTTNTLGHIPTDILERIMRECSRLLSPTGVVSMQIGYSDLFGHGDPTITVYNFLQFTERDWNRRRFNTGRHFQSRSRHADYRALFQRCGFTVVLEEISRPHNWKELLAAVPHIDQERFGGYDREDLSITSGRFVLRAK